MTSIIIPPNLYENLEMIALMVFPHVDSYSASSETIPTSIFGFSLQRDYDISLNP